MFWKKKKLSEITVELSGDTYVDLERLARSEGYLLEDYMEIIVALHLHLMKRLDEEGFLTIVYEGIHYQIGRPTMIHAQARYLEHLYRNSR